VLSTPSLVTGKMTHAACMQQIILTFGSGLPFSDFLSKVEPKRSVPVNALCLTVFVQLALNSIYFGTLTGFETVISIATEGFCTYSHSLYSWDVC
jgi:amino acid transporter